jgi:superfamily II DNA or RNA helicase
MDVVFHRGTLLLRGSPMPPWVSQLPGILWDPRVEAWRAPAFRWGEIEAALVSRGVRDRPAARTVPDSAPDSLGLRPYQEAALVAWEGAGRRGVVVLPTGAGKTRVGIAAMLRCSGRALFLVPTRVLMDQWLLRLKEAGVVDPGCFGDGRRDLRRVTVSTYESAWRWMERIGARFDLLVVDEAHHFGGGVKDEALEMAIAPWRLGLTATPADGAAAERVRSLVGPVVYRLGINDLAGSYLAPFDRYTITLELSPEERALYDRRMTAFHQVHRAFRRQCPEGSWADFARAASRSEEGRNALRSLRQARRMLSWPSAKRGVVASLLRRHHDTRTLLFTTDNDTAYAIAREHLVMPITCEISRRERDAVLARFRAGELRCLVSSRVLNEGVDVPDAEVGVVVGGAQGAREHVQRIGRVLRPGEGKRATVYELVVAGTSEVRKAENRSRGLAARTLAAL